MGCIHIQALLNLLLNAVRELRMTVYCHARMTGRNRVFFYTVGVAMFSSGKRWALAGVVSDDADGFEIEKFEACAIIIGEFNDTVACVFNGVDVLKSVTTNR